MSRTRDLIGLAEMVYTIPPGRGSDGAVCKTAPAKILTPIETVVSEEQNQHFVYFGRIFPIRGVLQFPAPADHRPFRQRDHCDEQHRHRREQNDGCKDSGAVELGHHPAGEAAETALSAEPFTDGHIGLYQNKINISYISVEFFRFEGFHSSPRQRITARSASATTATSSIATAESRTMGAKTPAPSSWVIIRREK